MTTMSIVDPAGFKETAGRPSFSSPNEAMPTETDVVLPPAEFAGRNVICLRAAGNCDVTATITNPGAAIVRIGFNNLQHLFRLNDVIFCPSCCESFKIDAVVSGFDISANNKRGMR